MQGAQKVFNAQVLLLLTLLQPKYNQTLQVLELLKLKESWIISPRGDLRYDLVQTLTR